MSCVLYMHIPAYYKVKKAMAINPEGEPGLIRIEIEPVWRFRREDDGRTTLVMLDFLNEIRASGSRCGEKSFGPAGPLQGSGTLDGVAADHAGDMARHDYFEHVDLGGHTPADRVRASGYREQLVGENIAYGPTSANEVVAGWLHSPGHCENIMDPRFQEMGLALAAGEGSRRGLYWDQVLAQPVR